MKISFDTTRDQPRLIRAGVAMLLAALDDGAALPLAVPANLILSEGERLANESRDVPPLAPLPPASDAAARAAFGGAPLAPPPVPYTADAAPPPTAPAAPTSAMPPAPPAPVPPPAPVAPVPSAPAAPSTFAPGVELDKDGLPWDARIHAATKSKVADGSWKMKKGMGSMEVYVNQVKAELRATMAIPATPAAPAAPMPPVPPVAPPAPPAAPVAPVPPAPPVVAAPTDFAGFMGWIAGLIAAGRWSHAQTATALGSMQLPSAVALSSRPDLIPQAVQTITAMLPPAA